MIFERFESSGLAQFSYLIGDGATALVIDPRRDCEAYVARAAAAGMQIRYILETHRHEDFVVGSVALAARTGAEIWHADAQLPYQYGEPVTEGQTWRVGSLTLAALHTPGHTPGSMSYVLRDAGGVPLMVFTGDVLFAGEVGRVDFLGMDRAPEMAGLLYDAIVEKFYPLGDGVLVCPAHGAGSPCGASIADRPWTTIGLERRLNPLLQHETREAFVAHAARELEYPPYFAQVERLNLEGAPILGHLPVPEMLTPDAFAERAGAAFVLDTRADLAFGGGHVPGSQLVQAQRVPRFAGWFVPQAQPILLVSEAEHLDAVVRYLIRLGYDDLVGVLAGDMAAWHQAGKVSRSVGMLTVPEVCPVLDATPEAWVLDVRSPAELREGNRIEGATNIHLTQLPEQMDAVPTDRPIYVFCGSGGRAMIAASLLKRRGREDVTVVLGGLSGWSSAACPVV